MAGSNPDSPAQRTDFSGEAVEAVYRVGYSLKILLFVFGSLQSPLPVVAAPPYEEAGKIIVPLDSLRFEVDPGLGARVTSLEYSGREILFLSSGSGNWGSTFWPSPQSRWGWPPPAALDNADYSGGIVDEWAELTSERDGATELVFKKVFRADSTDTSIAIRYTMINAGNSTVQYAPWEVTRLPWNGISFFPSGEDQKSGSLASLSQDREGATWLHWNTLEHPGGLAKLFSDGSEGWLAHANSTGEILIQKFRDSEVSQKAPDENEIEFFASPQKDYLEMEHQGPFSEIGPGDSLHWEVKWYVRRQSGMTLEAGNRELLDFVDAVVNPAPPTANRAAGVLRGPHQAARGPFFQLTGDFRVLWHSRNLKGSRRVRIAEWPPVYKLELTFPN